MYIVYGIPNCDTVKKSLTWLNNHKIPYKFHDYKKEGITAAKLKTWSGQTGWESFLNKKSTTWRGLDAKTQASITTEKAAIKLMTESTSIIKRPVIEKGDTVVTVGFNEAVYEKLFKK
jgi:arsenate reductase